MNYQQDTIYWNYLFIPNLGKKLISSLKTYVSFQYILAFLLFSSKVSDILSVQ